MEFMLAQKYAGDSVDGFLMSEKYDGFRACWDGQQLTSRQGNTFRTPQWFLDLLPEVPLDGELFAGRGNFQLVSRILLKKQASDDDWKKIKLMAFDAPGVKGTFKERSDLLISLLKNNPAAAAVEQKKCQNFNHVRSTLKFISELGGEGVILKKETGEYIPCRTWDMVKCKPHYPDFRTAFSPGATSG